MAKTIGLPNIITHLHREPGIDHAEHPALFNAAYESREELKKHFALEGLQLLIDVQLGAMSLVLMSPEQIEAYAKKHRLKDFRPIYASRTEEYWSSVLLVILRLRYEAAIANPEAGGISEEDHQGQEAAGGHAAAPAYRL